MALRLAPRACIGAAVVFESRSKSKACMHNSIQCSLLVATSPSNFLILMDLSHRLDVWRSDETDDLASVSEYADSLLDDIARTMRNHLDVVHLSDEDWRRRHGKRLYQVMCVKAMPLYLPMAVLRTKPGVFGNAPLTPNAYDRTKSKRTWEAESMCWRHSVSAPSCCFAAWKWSLLSARQTWWTWWTLACGLGGSLHTKPPLAHEHVTDQNPAGFTLGYNVESTVAESNDVESNDAGDRCALVARRSSCISQGARDRALSHLSQGTVRKPLDAIGFHPSNRVGLSSNSLQVIGLSEQITPRLCLSEAEHSMRMLPQRKCAPASAMGSQPGTRYLVSIYSLNPAYEPDGRDIICIMSFKGMLSDEGLWAFIIEHISTATPPELKLGPREEMHAMMFLAPTSGTRLPAVCGRLRCRCNSPAATRFGHPLIHGNMSGYWDTIGFLALEHDEWQQTRSDVNRLWLTLFAEEWTQRGHMKGFRMNATRTHFA